jgi:hypothetical protein
MGRPLTLALDKPNPKISWNLVRGWLTTSVQKFVRPDRVASPSALWPRASQVLTTLPTVKTAIDAAATPAAKNFRTRALVVNRLRPATRVPATKPTRAVLVCVRRRMVTATVTPTKVTGPLSRRASQSTTITPAATAAYWATCVAPMGQITPESLPPARA